ncbi:MAG: Unknown protein [uncultured Sulfurovum sp.]|uniref:Porin n=1 Tax=uncultured Sulfurovum sp. TaxID=269237 RepID=A0A6S6SWT4_9BACT|nr:MAG: Unknown protein [uncultured Sulfurovum sp.]
MKLITSVHNAMTAFNKYFFLLAFLLLSILPLTLKADSNLSEYVNKLEKRINVLEKEKKSQGILKLRSMNTTLFVGGRISLDTIYLESASGKGGGSNSSDQFFNANNIPINPQGENSELTLTARNSKFWMKTRTQQKGEKPLMTLLEVDFWGSHGTEQNSNSHNLRLRHAYMLYNGWILGQTNSLFLGNSQPHTMLAPVDDVFMRQALIGYKKTFKNSSLAIALEQPELVVINSLGVKSTINDDQLPDMVLKYEYHDNQKQYSLSLLARELRIDQEEAYAITDSTMGYGLNFTGQIDTYKNNTLSLGLVGGKGIGRYMATSFFPSAVLTADNKLKAQFSWGTHLAYEQWINQHLRLNVAGGWIETNPLLDLLTVDKSAWSAHTGLQYSPIKKFLLGIEYIHGERVLQNNQNYAVDRLYFRSSYDF